MLFILLLLQKGIQPQSSQDGSESNSKRRQQHAYNRIEQKGVPQGTYSCQQGILVVQTSRYPSHFDSTDESFVPNDSQHRSSRLEYHKQRIHDDSKESIGLQKDLLLMLMMSSHSKEIPRKQP